LAGTAASKCRELANKHYDQCIERCN
jgi:hypothetical protein